MPEISHLQRRAKFWLRATWTSGLILAVSIVVGFSALASRRRQTIDLIDEDLLTNSAYSDMIARSLFWIRAGFMAGALAFAAYLVSFALYHRAKTACKAASADS